MNTVPATDPPLAGVTVIEHASGVAAMHAGRILALQGATVIKVEPPGGESLRAATPQLSAEAGASVLFHYLNVGKDSVTLDLAQAPGMQLFEQLLRRADILIDDTPPGQRAAAGLDPDAVGARHPRLLYCGVAPFGAHGPRRDWLAHELNVFHSGGEGYLLPNGLALDLFPERPPVKIYGPFAELVGGIAAADAVLAALLVQEETGGQFIDVASQDANVSISCFNVQRVGDGSIETRHNRSFRYGGVLECADGYVQILTLEPVQWAGLVKLMGEPDWTRDPEMQDEIARGRRGDEINGHLRAWARTRQVDELVQGGQALRVPIARYKEPAEILAAEQSQARAMFTPVEFPGRGALPVLTAPFQFTLPASPRACPARAGADNARIFGDWLGHAPAALADWHATGVI